MREVTSQNWPCDKDWLRSSSARVQHGMPQLVCFQTHFSPFSILTSGYLWNYMYCYDTAWDNYETRLLLRSAIPFWCSWCINASWLYMYTNFKERLIVAAS